MELTQTISSLKDIHKGEDVYVLGSGGTLNFVDKNFFSNKIAVCVNDVGEVYLPTTQYVVTKYHREAIKWSNTMPDTKVIVSRGNLGNAYYFALPANKNLYTFEHNMNKDLSTSVETDWPQEENSLYVSWSSITSAIHFAAFIGAKNIILVAHDCGILNDDPWVNGYVYQSQSDEDIAKAIERNTQFENQTIHLKHKLQKLYSCNIYSLNPFINYNLEGIKYRGKNSIN